MSRESLDSSYFDEIYARDDDPWSFASSPYEARKYDDTLQMLGAGRFRNALEIGCSIGVLTRRLAERCDELTSVDVNERALAAARSRCADAENVRFFRMSVPGEFPSGPFDLVVLSEVAYYWSDADLALARDRIALEAAGGTLELVHYLPKVSDYVRDGDAVHESFANDPRFEALRGGREELYRIDVMHVR